MLKFIGPLFVVIRTAAAAGNDDEKQTAQEKANASYAIRVTGRVIDAESRRPIPRVRVLAASVTEASLKYGHVGWSKWLNVAGEQIDARTAQLAGFVQAVYPDEDFEEDF